MRVSARRLMAAKTAVGERAGLADGLRSRDTYPAETGHCLIISGRLRLPVYRPGLPFMAERHDSVLIGSRMKLYLRESIGRRRSISREKIIAGRIVGFAVGSLRCQKSATVFRSSIALLHLGNKSFHFFPSVAFFSFFFFFIYAPSNSSSDSKHDSSKLKAPL